MTNLQELLDRVKAATGPDRQLDFRIHIALVEDVIWPVRDRMGRVTNPNYRMSDYLSDFASVINSDDQDFDFPRYTASIDDALALTERVLPGCEYEITNLYHVALVSLPMNMSMIMDPHTARREDCNIPLAIIEAILSALISKESQS